MLFGEFQHNIDQKGRVIIPSRFRDDFGEQFIITKGLDNCLCAYSMDEWRILENKIRELPSTKARDLQRFFFSSAFEAIADKQGRVVIPPNLRSYAKLEKDIVIIGASNRAEIWNKSAWDARIGALTSESVEEAMDALGF